RQFRRPTKRHRKNHEERRRIRPRLARRLGCTLPALATSDSVTVEDLLLPLRRHLCRARLVRKAPRANLLTFLIVLARPLFLTFLGTLSNISWKVNRAPSRLVPGVGKPPADPARSLRKGLLRERDQASHWILLRRKISCCSASSTACRDKF